MNGKSEAPQRHEAHGQLLQIRDTFKSLRMDFIRQQNTIGYEEHETPEYVDYGDIVQYEIAKWEEWAIKQ